MGNGSLCLLKEVNEEHGGTDFLVMAGVYVGEKLDPEFEREFVSFKVDIYSILPHFVSKPALHRTTQKLSSRRTVLHLYRDGAEDMKWYLTLRAIQVPAKTDMDADA
ncbi:hypothetical protein M407DRAFT_35087 [Tulasnella calospora MUT 4182]|uniref:Uncharacterized protein n=1 Tax=Tulasnella calospora MUT 4182 TaxID=1051891 RepID=A0A0C3L0X5_9AGAM|nr:hypothetical protein M407DRAFT_35087 [Tulasnella calospora MUT 4182]